jgi:hypothetical protein
MVQASRWLLKKRNTGLEGKYFEMPSLGKEGNYRVQIFQSLSNIKVKNAKQKTLEKQE